MPFVTAMQLWTIKGGRKVLSDCSWLNVTSCMNYGGKIMELFSDVVGWEALLFISWSWVEKNLNICCYQF